MSLESCKHLVMQLTESVRRNNSDAILLSGGLDSSILAMLAKPQYAVTSAFGNSAPDVEYSKIVASRYCRKHAQVMLDEKQLLDIVEHIVHIFRTFDPMEIRNSSVAYASIEKTKSDGFDSVMTGDGADELFAGYNYLKRYHSEPSRLASELERLWNVMHFSSMKIGEELKVSIRSPFLDRKFSAFAKKISVDEKLGDYQGKKWGKFILRKCFERELGQEIAWREKLAQEDGSSVGKIQYLIESQMVDDNKFESCITDALKEGVRIRNKEHLYYYLIFRRNFSAPGKQDCDCGLRCPECSGCFNGHGKFCRICGAFPVTPITQK